MPPPNAQLGAPISEQQHGIIERFEAMLSHFLSVAPFEGSELGRAAGKFQGLIDTLTELPKSNLGFEDLFDVIHEMHKSFDSYGSHFAPKPKLPNPQLDHELLTSAGTVTVSMPSAKPVESARVKWENPPSFDAAGYLDPLVREAFLDPEVLRKPSNTWPKSKPAKMHITKSEMLKLIDGINWVHVLSSELTVKTSKKRLGCLRLIKTLILIGSSLTLKPLMVGCIACLIPPGN